MRAATDPHLVIVTDHPSLHRGFATVGRALARHLYEQEGWRLDYVGLYPPDETWESPGYRVIDLEVDDDGRAGRVDRLVPALKLIAASHESDQLVVLTIGTPFDLESTLTALVQADLSTRTRVVGYTPIDHAPISVDGPRLFQRMDAVVPFTQFSHDAIRDAARRGGVALPGLAAPIPHGVDASLFRPLAPEDRQRARSELFGLHGSELLLAFFGRNSCHKRTDLVLRLVHLLISGRYGICTRCLNANACALDREGRPAQVPDVCTACGGDDLRPGRPRSDVRLYMHTDALDRKYAAVTGGRDVEHIAARYGIREHLLLRDDISIGRGDAAALLGQRMAACDVHLLPYDRGGFELTVLETGACGVPNVVTEVSSPAVYAQPYSEVVPVGAFVVDDVVHGLIDVDLALRALLRLADDPDRRRELGARGPEVAAAHAWPVICARWTEVLRNAASNAPPDA